MGNEGNRPVYAGDNIETEMKDDDIAKLIVLVLLGMMLGSMLGR